jgi:kinesin light chain
VELYYKRAIDIYIKILGPNDLNVIKTKNNLASIYLKQQKYKEAEQLYKDVLTQVHEIDSQSSKQHSSSVVRTGNDDMQGNWCKTIRVDAPTVTTTLKNLSLLYRRQGQYDTADILENYASRARKDSEVIIQVLDIINQTNNSL